MATQLISQKRHVTSQQIKDIVGLLNSKPFNESLTLVALDQLDNFGLGDILCKICDHLDDPNNKTKGRLFNSKGTPPVEIIYKVTEFLKILGYENSFDEAWQNGLLEGDRKIIYPIYYYLLINLTILTKRAYLGRFMVPIQIPIEFSQDPEIKKLIQQNKQCQAEFQVVFEGHQVVNQTAMNTEELSKEIQQMQQEREQLNAKIREKKNNSVNKPDFQPLFQATNLLRKQQQQQARLVDKIQSQRIQLENAEGQLMSLQQSLADAQKSLAPSNTPEQMLQATKAEVRKNRQLVKQRMTLEYNQRLRKLQNTEKMLAEPPITQNQLLSLQQQMIGTRRLVAQMQQKLSKQNTQGDKLSIFKSQAAAVTKKKEQTIQALKKQEQELQSVQTQIRKKQDQINKLSGGMNINTSQKYLQVIKDKKAKFGKRQAQLQQIRQQLSNLKRTQEILIQQKSNYKSNYGLEEASQEHNLANASLEEINKQIDKLMDQIKKKKTEISPQLEEKKRLLDQFQGIQREHKQKKQTFETTIRNVEDEMKDVQTRVGKLKDQVYAIDTKIQLGRFKTQALQLKIDRLTQQSENLQGKGKKVGGGGFPSYQQYFKNKTAEREKQVIQLTDQRRIVSENHQPSLQQNKMFGDLKKLLQIKLKTGKGGNDTMNRKGQKHGANVNVLRME